MKQTIRTVLFILALLPLWGACNSGGGIDEQHAVDEESMEVQELTLESRYLRVDGDKVVFEPDSDRKQAAYTKYIFDKAEFIEKIGDPASVNGVRIEAGIRGTENKKYKPGPNMPSPSGGFDITNYRCVIKKVLK